MADFDPYGTNKRKYKAFEKTEKVQLRIGVFFDGTGNNRYNSDTVYYDPKYNKPPLEQDKIEKIRNFKSFVIESGSSYWNTYSNIALLHDLYEEKRKWEQDVKFQSLQMKFYIEDIGTLRDEEDDMVGSGMGEGERGVISRVEQACQNIADEIIKVFSARQKTIHKPLEIISIQFDVFGFSRGAAAARHFSNEVLKIGKDKNPGSGGNMPITEIKRPAAKKYEKIKDSLPSIQQYKKDAYKVEKDNTRVVQRFNAPERDIFIGGHLGNILQALDEKADEYVNLEVAKGHLNGYKDETVGAGLKTKDFKTWGNTYSYWQHHGIPYEAWANNEREYDIYFDFNFNKPNKREVGFGFTSLDGTFEQWIGIYEKFRRKLPVEFELGWRDKAKKTFYCSKFVMPKSFRSFVEKKELKIIIFNLEIDDNDRDATLYLVTNKTKEKILKFRNKQPTAEEKKNNEYNYATEVEYFMP
ncbi:hypothetical protein [Chryseobacterium gambrini]|uniref:hypothetical protein n=1 Tax=Chryseobacterium gambrini TaxID=373672 RepID=UPI003BA646C4